MDVFLQNARGKGDDAKENDSCERQIQSFLTEKLDAEQVGTIKLQDRKMFLSKTNFKKSTNIS